jgi:hypothetical protein
MADDATKPLTLAMPVPHDAKYGTEEPWNAPREAPKRHLVMERWRINGPIIVKAMACLTFPPAIFSWCMTWLSFHFHFAHPEITWIMALLSATVVLISAGIVMRAVRERRDKRWAVSGFILCAVALVGGLLLGDTNYLVNMNHYYFINSLKSYSNINPSKVSGTQMMDAGRVQFADGTRVITDMGMSFTMWNTYCVAPLGAADTTSVNSPNPGPTLASYDFWAVGKNCCKSSNPTFACGEYRNLKARSGLRQTNEMERVFFNLAVQQAEAAYDITAKHPIFFTWTEDADHAVAGFFSTGFKFWVVWIFFHMTINAFLVLIMVNMFKHPHSEVFDPS